MGLVHVSRTTMHAYPTTPATHLSTVLFGVLGKRRGTSSTGQMCSKANRFQLRVSGAAAGKLA